MVGPTPNRGKRGESENKKGRTGRHRGGPNAQEEEGGGP